MSWYRPGEHGWLRDESHRILILSPSSSSGSYLRWALRPDSSVLSVLQNASEDWIWYERKILIWRRRQCSLSVREHFSSPLLQFAAADGGKTFTLVECPSMSILKPICRINGPYCSSRWNWTADFQVNEWWNRYRYVGRLNFSQPRPLNLDILQST